MGDINRRIAIVVSDSKMTNTAFAEKINLTQSTVSRLVSGKQNPSERTIRDIADKFQINENWLRTGEGPMKIQKTREEELTQFFGKILNEDIPDRREIILALSRMPPEWWKATADMILSAADAIRQSESPDPDE